MIYSHGFGSATDEDGNSLRVNVLTFHIWPLKHYSIVWPVKASALDDEAGVGA